MISGKLGILSLLDEDCRLNRRQSQLIPTAFVEKLEKRLGDCRAFIPPSSRRDGSFGVAHYAGVVQYESARFVAKNKDSRRDGWHELVRGTTSLALIACAKADRESQGDGNGGAEGALRRRKKTPPTVVSKYRASLRQLFATLDNASPLFIRCIASNDFQRRGQFVTEHVLRQLRACGVLECVKISAAGLPHRMPHSKLLALFGPSARFRLAVRSALQLEPEQRVGLQRLVGESTPNRFPAHLRALTDRISSTAARLATTTAAKTPCARCWTASSSTTSPAPGSAGL